MPTTAPVCMASRQASSSSFSRRIAPTYTLALGFGLFAELLARHGRAVDAIPASLRANVNDGIPFARGFGVENLVAAHQSQREGVNQRISRVATFELHLAADVGDAEAVSVRGDATDHTFEHRVVLVQSSLIEAGLRRDGAEAQRVHDGERTRAHGKDVAQNTANAGCGSLERLDERRMIVRLDLEGAGPAIADVNDARVLARPLYHAAAVRREPLQVHSRRLVGAVLAPHHAEDAQLGERRLAPERFQNAVVFFWRDPMVAEHFWSDAWFLGDDGGAVNWVHGDKEGSPIVARTSVLGKNFLPGSRKVQRCRRIGKLRYTGPAGSGASPIIAAVMIVIALRFPTRQNGCSESPVQPEDPLLRADGTDAHRRGRISLPRRLAVVRRLLHGADHHYDHRLRGTASAVARGSHLQHVHHYYRRWTGAAVLRRRDAGFAGIRATIGLRQEAHGPRDQPIVGAPHHLRRRARGPQRAARAGARGGARGPHRERPRTGCRYYHRRHQHLHHSHRAQPESQAQHHRARQRRRCREVSAHGRRRSRSLALQLRRISHCANLHAPARGRFLRHRDEPAEAAGDRRGAGAGGIALRRADAGSVAHPAGDGSDRAGHQRRRLAHALQSAARRGDPRWRPPHRHGRARRAAAAGGFSDGACMKITTAAEMREIDRATTERFGIHSLTLMENAGSAIAQFILEAYGHANRIAVVCGKGNNGGDGFVVARKLHRAGRVVEVLLLALASDLRGDALSMFERLPLRPIILQNQQELQAESSRSLANCDLLVD